MTLQTVLESSTRSNDTNKQNHLEKVHEMAHAILTLAQKVQVELEGSRDVITGAKGKDNAAVQPGEQVKLIRNLPSPAQILQAIEEEHPEDFQLPNIPELPSTPEAEKKNAPLESDDDEKEESPSSSKNAKLSKKSKVQAGKKGKGAVEESENLTKPQSPDESPKSVRSPRTSGKRKAQHEEGVTLDVVHKLGQHQMHRQLIRAIPAVNVHKCLFLLHVNFM
jgi:hypothetical protein